MKKFKLIIVIRSETLCATLEDVVLAEKLNEVIESAQQKYDDFIKKSVLFSVEQIDDLS